MIKFIKIWRSERVEESNITLQQRKCVFHNDSWKKVSVMSFLAYFLTVLTGSLYVCLSPNIVKVVKWKTFIMHRWNKNIKIDNVDSIVGRWHHVHVGCTVNISGILTVSIFKAVHTAQVHKSNRAIPTDLSCISRNIWIVILPWRWKHADLINASITAYVYTLGDVFSTNQKNIPLMLNNKKNNLTKVLIHVHQEWTAMETWNLLY